MRVEWSATPMPMAEGEPARDDEMGPHSTHTLYVVSVRPHPGGDRWVFRYRHWWTERRFTAVEYAGVWHYLRSGREVKALYRPIDDAIRAYRFEHPEAQP